MYSPFRYIGYILWKKRPIHLTFFVTRRCNARCPFCFYLSKKGESADYPPEISLNEIEKISLSLRSLLWVAFSGGEVYLREDIVDISRILYKNNKPTILLYSTNGLMPELIRDRTEEILKYCRESVVVVKLSLDGLYSEHDALRGVPGSFERVLETYYKLSELLDGYSNFELGVNTVFCSSNQDDIKEIFEFVKGLDKIKTHTLSMIRGEIEDESLKNVDLNKYYNVIKTMENDLKRKRASMYRFRGARLKTAQDILQRRLIYQTMSEKRSIVPCYAGKLNLVLTETGDVYPCELLNQKLGNVKDYNYDVKKILQSKQAKRIIYEIRKNGCYCSHECNFIMNILFNPAMYPKLAKEYLQL